MRGNPRCVTTFCKDTVHGLSVFRRGVVLFVWRVEDGLFGNGVGIWAVLDGVLLIGGNRKFHSQNKINYFKTEQQWFLYRLNI